MITSTLTEISKFLTKDVIEKAHKLRTNSQDIVKELKVTRAAPEGEGLLSAVFRIHVTGHQYSTAFVVKGLVTDLVLRRTLECEKYFKREADFFTDILPVLIEVQASLGAEERIQNHIPTCYGCHQDDVNDFILLEDLSESKCESVSQTPTKEEKDGVLNTLAHLHAVSMALRIKRPEKFTEIASAMPEVYFNEENRDWYKVYLANAVDIDRKVVAELEDPDSIYFKKFHELLTKDIYGECITFASTWGDHPVLCHGDAWSPNFLYSPDRTVVIDFQLSRCASPATDLAYWIMLCSNHTTKKQDFMDAVEVYYTSIQHYLKDMGLEASKVFSREALHHELKQYGKFGFLSCLTSLPLMTSDRCDTLKSMKEKFPGVDKIPLECLWQVAPLKHTEHKLRLMNAIRVAVDVGLI